MFGKNLKRLMWEKHFTCTTLAEETGFSKSSISQYANGINIPPEGRIRILAEVLDVSVEELMDGEPQKPQKAVIPPVDMKITGYTLSVKQAAELMHKHTDYVRLGLQEGRPGFEFGSAVKTSTKWSYCIYAKKFTEVTGIPVNIVRPEAEQEEEQRITPLEG